MKTRQLAILMLLVATAALWTACTIGFDPGPDPGRFYCETDDDCLTEEGYECDTESNRCDDGIPDPDQCIDEDGDGYGTGTNRQGCPQPDVDCDDTNADIYPGAPEICDGQYNGCEDGIDSEAAAFSCTGDDADGCPSLADVPEGMTSAADFLVPECESGQCVYKSLRENDCTEDGSVIKMTCENSNNYSWVRDSTKSYADLPPACRDVE